MGPESSEALARRPRSADLWIVVGVALLGALPTVVHLLGRPTLLVDDWGFAALAGTRGMSGFLTGSDIWARPGQAIYHGATFVVLGSHPVPHLILLAALNAAAAVLLLLVTRSWFEPRVALLVTLAWVVIANRGATRLWISTAPIMVSLVVLLLAGWFASRPRSRPAVTVGLVAVSTLFYEGGVLIGLAVVIVACWRSSPTQAVRVRRAVVGVAGVVAVAVWVLATSPKSVDAAEESSSVVAALFGSGLLPGGLSAASIVVVLAVLVVSVTAVLSMARMPSTARLVGAGWVVTGLGIAPFLVAGFPLATDGMLDRANTFASLGIALLLAAVLDQFWRAPGPVAAVAATACLLVLAGANLDDLRDARAAGLDGEEALSSFSTLDVPPGTKLVLAPMPAHGGWSAFGYDSVGAAVEVTTGRSLDIIDTLTEQELERADGIEVRFVPGAGVVIVGR